MQLNVKLLYINGISGAEVVREQYAADSGGTDVRQWQVSCCHCLGELCVWSCYITPVAIGNEHVNDYTVIRFEIQI